MNNDLGKMHGEVVVPYHKMLFWHLVGRTEDNNKYLSQYNPCPSWHLNPESPEIKGVFLQVFCFKHVVMSIY